MASIYVSVPSLSDTEVIKTLFRAINRSSKSNKISVGAAMCLFPEETKNYTTVIPNKNINIKVLDRNTHIGVGIARKEAMSFYDGEDYILTIDAHSEFMDNWDTILIDKFNTLNVDKSVLTCYPPEYKYLYKNFTVFPNEWKNINISKFDGGTIRDIMPHRHKCKACEQFDVVPLWKEKPVEYKKDGFILNNKLSGGFLFSDKKFAEVYNDLIPYNFSFFEEELIMSIEAFNLGFTFYTPTDFIPVAHLYSEFINDNGGDRSSLTEDEVLKLNTKVNYLNYILNPKNKKKIKRFEKHFNVNILSLAEAKSEKSKNRTATLSKTKGEK